MHPKGTGLASTAPATGTKTVLPPPPTIPPQLVKHAWNTYKDAFIQRDGRVIDHKGGAISTSEGQAYAMVRALWTGDQVTFGRVLTWAERNLQEGVREDHLFAWKWGHRDDGSWGVHDPHAASDADQLIAWALLGAAKRWRVQAYRSKAIALLGDIWDKEVLQVGERAFLLPGDWSAEKRPLVLNPSYYLPFAYRAFAEADPDHPWATLIDTSYLVFEGCRSQMGLPVDWCHLDLDSGQLTIPLTKESDFGYEAFRVFWTLAADHRWHGEDRALARLKDIAWLKRHWAVRGHIPSRITHDGIPREDSPYLGQYGSLLPALASTAPAEAELMYQRAISPSWKAGAWGDGSDYYQQNWVWFGLALQSTLEAP